MSVWTIAGFGIGVALFAVGLFAVKYVIWRLRGKPFGAFPGSTWDGPIMLTNLWASERELEARHRIWGEERWLRVRRKHPVTYAELAPLGPYSHRYNGATRCSECGAPKYTRHTAACPVVVGAEAPLEPERT